MNDDLRDDEAEDNKAAATENAPYRPRRARDPLVLMIAMLLFAMLAIAGIVVAVTSEHKNPNTIVLPVHTAKSLDQEQPLSSAASPTQETSPAEEMSSDMVLDKEELPSSKIEELEQHEQPMDLKPMTPVPEFSPQGLRLHQNIEQHAGQSIVHYQKKTSQRIQSPKTTPIVEKSISGTTPLVVIVIDDMGLNHRNSLRVVDLPASITLAYLPYAERLPTQTEQAFSKGHELIVHMPMEPDNVARNNPGPNALLSTLSSAENVTRLNKNLGSFQQYMGLNNHMGSKLTTDAAQMRPIMQEIKAKGLWFLDSRTIGNSVAARIAAEEGVPYAVRDVFLDNVPSVVAVMAQLRETERVAKAKGYAIAIGHPHDATIQALQQWIPQARSKGISIVPLSTIIAKRFPQSTVPQYARTRTHAPQSGVQQETATQDSGSKDHTPVAHNG